MPDLRRNSTPPTLPPTLAVFGTSVRLGLAESVKAGFTVRLSAPSSSPVTVSYATTDGTAHAGAGYDTATGTLTFAPGQVQAFIPVTVHPATAGTTAFTVTLSAPHNATLSVARAGATLVTAPPTLTGYGTVVHQAITLAPARTDGLLPDGYLSTRDNQIVDVQGDAVRLKAVNWFGLETPSFAPHGLWAQSYTAMMDEMVKLGFNTIRLPFSDQLFDANSTPSGIDYTLNPDLAGLNGLGIMDKIVAYAGKVGLKIILDHSRSDASLAGPNEDGLWYQGAYTEARWISDWTMLARHYAGNTTIIGADLHDEPHGAATWGDGSANDWAAAATRAGDAIQQVEPGWLIVVEGNEQYEGHWTWWGGNLMGARDHPVTLTMPGKVVYSPHDYPSSVTDLPPFHAADYPNNFPELWNQYWGYLYETNTAPLWLGEFGSTLQTDSDKAWGAELIKYIDGDLAGAGGPSVGAGQAGIGFGYWAWNPDAGVTYGIVQNDWITPQPAVIALLSPALGSQTSANTATAALAQPDVDFTVSLSRASATATTVHYATRDGTAHAGTDYVATSGDLTFAAGETTKIVAAHLLPAHGTGQATVLLDVSGAGAATRSLQATIILEMPAAGSVALSLTALSGGFAGMATVANNTGAAVRGWQVQLTTADVISGVVGGTVVSHSGTNWVIGPQAGARAIAAHGSVPVQFMAAGNADVTARVLRFA